MTALLKQILWRVCNPPYFDNSGACYLLSILFIELSEIVSRCYIQPTAYFRNSATSPAASFTSPGQIVLNTLCSLALCRPTGVEMS